MKQSRWSIAPRQQQCSQRRLSGATAQRIQSTNVRSSRWAVQTVKQSRGSQTQNSKGTDQPRISDKHCSRWDSGKRCQKVAAATSSAAAVPHRYGALMVRGSDAKPTTKRKAVCEDGIGPADETTREHARRHCKQDAYKTCARCRHMP